ncbi:MAG TPA: hypothetical protein VNM38_09875 [Solirubrobacterales bacterium]|nr:hypothetical protein [Solirubrobacterales bacterium]
MTTVVENKESSPQQSDKPSIEIDAGFGSAADRFDKVEADMKEGFARVDQSINGLRDEMNGIRGEVARLGEGLRGEMNQLGESLRVEMNTRLLALEGDFKSLQRTLIGSTFGVVGAIIATALLDKIS